MKTKFLSILAICVALAGCTASQRHLSSDYKGYGFNTFETPRGTYKVVDNPETGKLFVLPTAGYVLSKAHRPRQRRAPLRCSGSTRPAAIARSPKATCIRRRIGNSRIIAGSDFSPLLWEREGPIALAMGR